MKDSPNREVVIFTEAVQLPAGERPAYLAGACGGDAELRNRVEDLLRTHDHLGDFLETSPQKAAVEARAESTAGEKAGDRIGRYKLLQQIGEGGWGVVFMAEQDEPVRRKVALKVVKPGMDTKNVIARFEAERQALALMDHPNIAHVFDAGATENGRPYFVMELVRGVKITDYCDQNCMPTNDRLELFIEVCNAVQHAHQKGIIHRDIKPSNILVTTSADGKRRAKLARSGDKEHRFMIRFHKAGKSFGNSVALRPTDLEIPAKKTTVLIGLSGSGKSTILRLISGLVEPTTGWVEIDEKRLGRDTILEFRRRMGYVIQNGDLFPHLTARRNIVLAAQELRLGINEINARVEKLCHLVKLPSTLLDRYPVELSGGEQRRVSLIRALMLEPDILLLDEPLTALDPMARAGLLRDFRALFERMNTTVIMVTHNLVEAARLGDRIVLLKEGSIVQQGPFAQLSLFPAEPFVSEFFHAQMDEVLA